MKFWILVRPRPQSNRCDAGREEKEAPAAGASADVSSAARVLKTPAISGIYNARLKQPGNVNSSALMPVLGRKPFKYLSLAVRRRNETHTPGAVLARRMGLRVPALEAQWDRQGPARRGPDGRLAPSALEFTPNRPTAPPTPLWGRTEEGGRAVLCDEPATAHLIISSIRATPHPCPPPQEGAGALTPSIPSERSRL